MKQESCSCNMSNTYKKNLIQAYLLKIFHQAQLSCSKISERDLVLEAAILIRHFLPQYNYAIWRFDKQKNTCHDNVFEDVIFEDSVMLGDHCFHIIIFQKGSLKLKKKNYTRSGAVIYGGPKRALIRNQDIPNPSRFLKFWRRTKEISWLSFRTVDGYNEEKQIQEVFEKFKHEMHSEKEQSSAVHNILEHFHQEGFLSTLVALELNKFEKMLRV